MKGGESLADIHTHLEHIAEEELEIAKKEQRATGIHRPDASPLTEKEKRLSTFGQEVRRRHPGLPREVEDQSRAMAPAARHS